MKKVISNTGDVISFLVRGVRNTNTAVEYDIDEKGIVMRDEDANIIADRLGSQVTVSDIDVKEAKKEAEQIIANATAPKVSDAVKALAEEHGIDLSTITGTGANGNIVKADIEAAIAAKAN